MDEDLPSGYIFLDLDIEIYFDGREDTLVFPHRFPVFAHAVAQGSLGVQDIMQEAEETLMGVLNLKGEVHIVLRSSLGTRQIVMVDKVTAWAILVPDQDTVDNMIERAQACIEGEDDDEPSSPA